MDIGQYKSQLSNCGYVVIPVANLEPITNYRLYLSHLLKSISNQELDLPSDPEYLLNHIHQTYPILADNDANNLVQTIIKSSSNYDFAQIVFESSARFITELFGSDIHAQKSNNIVFQYPGSLRYSELHTDSPTNSPFEIVAWVPLVNCYSSKSFYICNHETTQDLLQQFYSKSIDWATLRQLAIENSNHLEINYGSALFFWAGLLHGSVVNTTSESRWSLNTRFKSLFAPAGLHDPLIFYKVLSTSPISDMALDYLKRAQ